MRLASLIVGAAAAWMLGGAALAGGGWRTEVVAEPVPARDPAWSVVIQRFKQPAVVAASLPRLVTPAGTAAPAAPARTHKLDGLASFYWQEQTTASGERFDPSQMTAAHPTLPFNTLVRVRNPANGRSVVVRINDRGPFKPGRVIDLAAAAADEIGMRKAGIARVKLEVVQPSRVAAGL